MGSYSLPRDPRAEAFEYSAWSKTHGLKPVDLRNYLTELEWMLDDPRFSAGDFVPPQSIRRWFAFGQMQEAELLRTMEEGPPYHPRFALEGSLGLAHLHMFYPEEWVFFFRSMGMPDPKVTMEHWEEWLPLVNDVLVMEGGDLLSNYPFSLNDPGWSLVALSYMALLLDPDLKPPFATDPARIKITDSDSLTIAVTGDVGTGAWQDGQDQISPAEAVMGEMAKVDADYTIHLGDVYFLGTSPWIDRFVDLWVPGRRGSFTLNGNHEMYAWGKGLFEVALTNEKFAAQQGTTYFSIEFGDWIIVGLDTAYFDESPVMFQGIVDDPAQKAFLREIGRQAEETGQKVVLLTHHNGLDVDGSKRTKLWNEVAAEDALGRAPDYWYWGHVHSGIVYSADSASDEETLCRCAGHGSAPHGDPIELAESTGPGKPIQWYANTPYDDGVPEHRGRVLNGFATLTFSEDGLVERYIDQRGNAVEI